MKTYTISFILALLLSATVYPIQYFFSTLINFLPLQFIIYIIILFYFFKIKLDKKALQIIGIFIFYFITMGIYNINNAVSIITNSVLLTIFTLLLVGIMKQVKHHHIKYLDPTLKLFFVVFIFYSIYLNLEHSIIFGMDSRSVGFGSGTLYATLSVIAIIYNTDKFKDLQIKTPTYLLFSFVPAWSILLTQSRGALLTLGIVLIFMNLSYLKRFLKFSILIAMISVFIIMFFPEFFELEFIKRLNPSSYKSIEGFTSNRLQTQIFIFNWLDNENSILSLFFGNGFNELKYIVYRNGIEFPHFDLLYIVYDGGYFSVLFYVFCIGVFIVKSNIKYYPLIYLLSGFHTNMILSPSFIILLFLLAMDSYLRKNKYINKQVCRQ